MDKWIFLQIPTIPFITFDNEFQESHELFLVHKDLWVCNIFCLQNFFLCIFGQTEDFSEENWKKELLGNLNWNQY